VKSTKHVHALSANDDAETRVVQHRRPHKVADWIQEHAAVHGMRFAEVARQRGQREWSADCETCGMKLASVKRLQQCESHVKSDKHVNALSANDDAETRVVQHRLPNQVAVWIQEHAAVHGMRFAEVANRQYGRRAWNVDCEACGMTLASVTSVEQCERHVKSARHTACAAASPPSKLRKRPRT
jgi:macrodomain Ter protein organizer (MatP/YcbG family)